MLRYFVRKTGGKTAHIWTGRDTLCTMASTNGLSRQKYHVVYEIEQLQLKICTMCEIVKKRTGYDPYYNKYTKKVIWGDTWPD